MVTACKVGAVIQARMMSRRLRGKVLLNLPFGSGITIVENIIRRAQSVQGVDSVIVATSDREENMALVPVAAAAGALVFRGSEEDVLARFRGVAIRHGLEHVIRLTADNPFIDPKFLRLALKAHLDHGADYTRSVGLPLGVNLEIVSSRALDRLDRVATRPDDREHVTLYINRNQAEFKVCNLDLGRPEFRDLRMTVDWWADYAFACFVYEHLFEKDPLFGLDAVLPLLDRYPWAKMINLELKQEQ